MSRRPAEALPAAPAAGVWRWYPVALAGTALLAIGLRLRFVFTPITSDEGGYLAVARAWANGGRLYRDAWVDRPQGLLALYRLWSSLGGGNPVGVRVLAIVAGAVAVLACASIARQLFGEVAGLLAGLFVAVLTAAPTLEGFIANGELLSGAVGASSLAVALRGIVGSIRPWVLFGAGILGGLAFSLKQSGADGFVTALVCVAALAAVDPRRRPRAVRGLAALGTGFAAVLAALMLHGASVGWSDFWYANVGYRLSQRSGLVNADWERFATTLAIAMPVLAPVAFGVVAMVVAVRPSPGVRRMGVLAVWLAMAVVAFLSGGQFHRHYWVILAFPLGTAAGCVLSLVRSASMRGVIAAVMLANPVVITARAVALPRDEVAIELNGDPRLVKDEAVAAWFEAHRDADSTLYALCASAGLYGNVETDPPYPYLWLDGVTRVPGAQAMLEEMFASEAPPTYVALYQDPDRCNPSGVVGGLLRQRYRIVADVMGVQLLQLRT